MPSLPPSLREVERVVAAYLAENYPTAVSCSIVVALEDDYGRELEAKLPVRLAASSGDPFADSVLNELVRFAPGEWVKIDELAALLKREGTGGNFRKRIAALGKAKIIETGRHGCRIPAQKGTEEAP